MVSSTHPSILFPCCVWRGGIAGPDDLGVLITARCPSRDQGGRLYLPLSHVVAVLTSPSRCHQHGFSSQQARHAARHNGQYARIFSQTSGPGRSVLVADVLHLPTGGRAHDFSTAPRSLLPSYSCLSALPMSRNAVSFVPQSITNGWRLAFPLVRRGFSPEYNASARQHFVRARSVRAS